MQKIDLNKVYQRIRNSSDTLESIPEGADLDSLAFEDKARVTLYTIRFLKLVKEKGNKFFISWNWAALFFRWNWLFYRRAYLEAVLSLIPLVIFAMILIFFDATKHGAGVYFVLLWFLCYGLFGDYLFLQSVLRNINKIKDFRPSLLIGIFGGYIAFGILVAVLSSFSSMYHFCMDKITPRAKTEIVQYSEK